ncbi:MULTISPECIES: hypothetical protein [Pseudomonadaceae]|uniref:hypothetical protein n=1 Tax=Pseudomonadaceae TaxID=135621 RepID=UPI0009F186D3|nr:MULTISPECIES: hypothetical protein [Pseudomonas]
MKPISIKHASDDLALAILAGRVVSEYDEPDPELLGSSIEEEEEEEEGAEDRGDEVDPDLPPEEDEGLELEEDDQGDNEQDADPDGDGQDDELDEDALAKIAGTGRSATVPHARFNEVNESLKEERKRRLELEEELARTRGAVPAKREEDPKPTAFDYDEAEDRYNQAILEGDADAAKAIRREIRAAERKEIEEAAQQRADALYQQRAQEAAQRQQQAALPGVLKESYEKFPFLDYEGSAPNMEAIEDVIALRNHYMANGEPIARALARAVAKVGPRYAEPVSDDKTPKKGVTLTTEQIDRNLKRERATPPLTPGVGERGASVDVANMSEEDFAKLSAEDKKRERGDYISR